MKFIFIFLLSFWGIAVLAQKPKTTQNPTVFKNTIPIPKIVKPKDTGIKFPTPEIVFNVVDFGAKPNDGKDDAPAIQRAIDSAVYSGKTSKVYIPAGVYDLDKGVVAARLQADGEYFFNTITISGQIATSSTMQRMGAVTAFNIRHKGFGIALQLGRQCIVENIAFAGVARYQMSVKNIVEYKDEDWGVNGNQSNDINSPSCAIVIDPFHSSVPEKSRYLDCKKYYNNKGTGGTSMLTIKGCAFERFYIAIANNSSAAIANGDNIRAENCHVQFCHTFWSCGQTQSRGNSIDNVYAIIIHTFINGRQIGQQYGTPPMVSNLNLAGFCKELVNLNTGFSGIHFYRSYMESLWSMGRAIATAVSFDQCQFQLFPPNEDVFAPPFMLYSVAPVSFRDCAIEYFSNCTYGFPFVINAPSVYVSGGTIEGGLLTSGGFTSTGGGAMNHVIFNQVKIKCLGKVAGIKPNTNSISNLDGQIILGGETLNLYDKSIYLNNGGTYKIIPVGNETISIDRKTKKGIIITKQPELYEVGQLLFPTNDNLNPAEVMMTVGGNVNYCLGYVSSVVGQKVEISGIPYGLTDRTQYLVHAKFNIFDRKNTTGLKAFKVVE